MRLIIKNKKLNFFSHMVFIVLSFYLSFVIFFGGLLGYVSAKYITKKAVKGSLTDKGRIKLLIIKFKNYKFHLHHWLLGAIALVLYIFFSNKDNHFIISFMSGIIAEDFLCDKDFYKVFGKEKNLKITKRRNNPPL